MTETVIAGLYDLVVKLDYQVETELQQTLMIPRIQEFIKEFFPRSISFDKRDFEFKYHGRFYAGRMLHQMNHIEDTGGFPQEVYNGSISLKIWFPNKNGSNRRVRNKLQRLILPYERIDKSFL